MLASARKALEQIPVLCLHPVYLSEIGIDRDVGETGDPQQFDDGLGARSLREVDAGKNASMRFQHLARL